MKLRSAGKVAFVTPGLMNSGRLLLLLLLLAGLALSQAAQAASDAISDCNRLESSLRSLEVPEEQLVVEDSALEATAEAGTLPILRLTPRASSITREVFAALPIVMLDEDGKELDTPPSPDAAATKTAGQTSPLRAAPSTIDSPAVSESDNSTDSPVFLPRFQRQMYRTDI